MTLDPSTGTLSGTPLAPSTVIDASNLGNGGTFNFGVTVQDATGATTVREGSLTIDPSIPGSGFLGSLPHLAANENWTTSFTLVNKSGTSAQAKLNLFGDPDGVLPLTFALPQLPGITPFLTAVLDGTLNANASLIANTAGQQIPPVQVGSAQLSANGAVDGFAIFHHVMTQQETVVPLETRNASSYLLAFDNTGGGVLGVAVANISAQTGNMGVVIRDDSGEQIGHRQSISMARNGHTSFVLPRNIRLRPTFAAP